ncbi:recombinase family protein [Flavobacterium sp.]|uniref:recombinase family protein n=1 Tax=Flavobacterium sp. TaxID=239 RepID=UPI003752AEE9
MKKGRYIRQSSTQQSNLRQLYKAHPDETLFVDIISGSIPFGDRPAGKKLIEAIEANTINYVSFHDISRAGRDTINVLQTLKFLFDKGVVVKVDNLGLESMINNKPNPIFNLIITVLSEINSLEKTTLLERQKEGIAAAKRKNPDTYKGRVLGTVDTEDEILSKHKRTVKAMKANPTLSLRQIAKLASDSDYKVSANTVKKVKGIMEKENNI